MNCRSLITLSFAIVFSFITLSCYANLQGILDRGKLIVALPTDNYSIFIHKTKTGKLTGFDVELAKDIAKQLGLRLEFKYSKNAWDGLPTMIAQNQADIALGSLSITLNRAKIAAFTSSYIHLKPALLISRLWMAQHQMIRPKKALQQISSAFGVMQGSSFAPIIKQLFPLTKLKYYNNLQGKITALLTGKVDAIVMNEATALHYIKHNPAIAFKYKMLILTDVNDDIGMLVSYQNQDLLYWLNLYLATKKIDYHAKQVVERFHEKAL